MKTQNKRKDWAIALIRTGIAILERDAMGEELGEVLTDDPEAMLNFAGTGSDSGIRVNLLIRHGGDEHQLLNYWVYLNRATEARHKAAVLKEQRDAA